MILDEQELRQHLQTAAGHASPPRFTIEGLSHRIRRRRARTAGLVSGALAAVAAIAVAVPVALSGGPGTTAAHPAKIPFELSYTVAVNGQPRAFHKNGSAPRFAVTPGEHLDIQIGVTVPAHHTVTTLWLGISKGVFTSPGRHGQRPSSMRPVLAHTRTPLTPGLHRFRLRWIVPPRLRHGTSLWLLSGWTTNEHDTSTGEPVAQLAAR